MIGKVKRRKVGLIWVDFTEEGSAGMFGNRCVFGELDEIGVGVFQICLADLTEHTVVQMCVYTRVFVCACVFSLHT